MGALTLTVTRADGAREPLLLEEPALVIAGYTGRDAAAVQRHIDELAAHGVEPPPAVPMLWPLPAYLLAVAGDGLEVPFATSCGEAEPVLIRTAAGELFVTVGSDQTDREVERASVLLSKLVCPKIVAAEAWPFAEVAAGWDGLRLRSLAGGALYQDGPASLIRRPEELLALVDERAVAAGRALVLFCGTVPLLDGAFRFDRSFAAELEDASRGRALRCAYSVTEVSTQKAGA